MRIIAGEAKGLTIKAPKGLQIRPTSDKVREAIFSSLGDKVVDAVTLDLFAGSGALGLEALSRGAYNCIFVDQSLAAIKTIKENLERLNFSQKARVYKKEVSSFLNSFNTHLFDLILIDAPYRIGLTRLQKIAAKAQEHLTDEGIIVVEHIASFMLADHIKVIKEKKYGQTMISYIEKSVGN